MTRLLRLFFIIAFVVIIFPAYAAEISIGKSIGDTLRDIITPIITAAVAALVGWVAMVLKNKFNIDIESQYRDALTTFLQRQASSLIAQGAVRLEGVKINVQSDALASAANAAFVAIPQVINYFGLTPDRIAQMIVDHIPKQPSVAAATAIAMDAANPATPSK